jgi:hypothetical protein
MNRIVVASLKKGHKLNESFVKENAITLRERCVVEETWVEEINANMQNSGNGEFYEIDEKATAERLEGTEELESKKEDEKAELESLRAEYKELAKSDPKGNWGAKKLKEEIEALKK